MTTYVALLRGINVGGRTKVAMEDLRAVFAAAGHRDVQTYIQTGNVLFRPAGAEHAEPPRLAADIEQRLAQDLGMTITVLLRTKDELTRIATANPYLGRGFDMARLYVTFLADVPDPARAAQLESPADDPDEFSLSGQEVYLHCPGGYGRTKLNNAYLERRLQIAATTRGWRVVNKLRELMAE